MSRLRAVGVFAAVLAGVLSGGCGGGGSGPAALTIDSAAPPGGTTGMAYAGFTFTASGGSPPVSWSATGTLPPGLSLSPEGELSGTPGIAGSYAFTVGASDSSMPQQVAGQSFSITIADTMIEVAAGAPPAATAFRSPPPSANACSIKRNLCSSATPSSIRPCAST